MRRDRSLKHELTRRLVLVLVVVGAFGAMAVYLLGSRYANAAYDRALVDDVYVLSGQVRVDSGNLDVNLPPDALIWMLADEGDEVLYRVTDLSTRRVIAANGDLGAVPETGLTPEKAYFRSVTLGKRAMRIGYLLRRVQPGDIPVLVEIGETTNKRVAMTQGILAGIVPLMITIILVAVALVWRGVGNSLAPLKDLEAAAARRSIGNLVPLDPERAPAEVRGLIEAINHMIVRVSGSIDSQRRFIANAAHQLKTPIAGLRLQAQIALKAESLAAAQASMVEVERSAARASRLIEQLLTLSRAEAPESATSAEPVDLAKVARDVIELRLPEAIAKRIDLGFEGQASASVVMANEVLVGELVGNLVDNSVRYASTNGRVTLIVASRDETVTISVIDDGPGLPAPGTEWLFRRFHRPDSSVHGGAGLGLAIVREIADRYGATISVASRPEIDGTRIDVCFPFFRPPSNFHLREGVSQAMIPAEGAEASRATKALSSATGPATI